MRTSILFSTLLFLLAAGGLVAAGGAVGAHSGGAVGAHPGGGSDGAAKNMIAFDLSSAVPGVRHVGLTAPDFGAIHHLQWTTQTSGAAPVLDPGAVTAFEVIREADNSVLCSVSVPCAQAVGGHVHVGCGGVSIEMGEHLDVRPAAPSVCLLQPKGTLVATFFWQ